MDCCARRLAGSTKPPAVEFVARVGGDEFAMIATGDAQSRSAGMLGERLLAAFQVAFEIDGQLLHRAEHRHRRISGRRRQTPTALLANADAALYRAKADGRGAMRFFEAEMDARLHERRAHAARLAAGARRNELDLHYQPQVAGDGEIIGFEALVRWHHPTRGLISPADFIPIAEESGLIMPLGEWVLARGLPRSRDLAAAAPDRRQPLADPVPDGDLRRLVHEILCETGLAPQPARARNHRRRADQRLPRARCRSCAASRRSACASRWTISAPAIRRCRYLQSFPFDKIKIDRTFIGNIERSHHSSDIVRAIIGLGHSLEIPVVAEGVETAKVSARCWRTKAAMRSRDI